MQKKVTRMSFFNISRSKNLVNKEKKNFFWILAKCHGINFKEIFLGKNVKYSKNSLLFENGLAVKWPERADHKVAAATTTAAALYLDKPKMKAPLGPIVVKGV